MSCLGLEFCTQINFANKSAVTLQSQVEEREIMAQ
jgi:hypothetical protein